MIVNIRQNEAATGLEIVLEAETPAEGLELARSASKALQVGARYAFRFVEFAGPPPRNRCTLTLPVAAQTADASAPPINNPQSEIGNPQ